MDMEIRNRPNEENWNGKVPAVNTEIDDKMPPKKMKKKKKTKQLYETSLEENFKKKKMEEAKLPSVEITNGDIGNVAAKRKKKKRLNETSLKENFEKKKMEESKFLSAEVTNGDVANVAAKRKKKKIERKMENRDEANLEMAKESYSKVPIHEIENRDEANLEILDKKRRDLAKESYTKVPIREIDGGENERGSRRNSIVCKNFETKKKKKKRKKSKLSTVEMAGVNDERMVEEKAKRMEDRRDLNGKESKESRDREKRFYHSSTTNTRVADVGAPEFEWRDEEESPRSSTIRPFPKLTRVENERRSERRRDESTVVSNVDVVDSPLRRSTNFENFKKKKKKSLKLSNVESGAFLPETNIDENNRGHNTAYENSEINEKKKKMEIERRDDKRKKKKRKIEDCENTNREIFKKRRRAIGASVTSPVPDAEEKLPRSETYEDTVMENDISELPESEKKSDEIGLTVGETRNTSEKKNDRIESKKLKIGGKLAVRNKDLPKSVRVSERSILDSHSNNLEGEQNSLIADGCRRQKVSPEKTSGTDASRSKELGLDLRWDKPKILKDELKRKGLNSAELTKPAQCHVGKEGYLRTMKDIDDSRDWKKFKARALSKLEMLSSIADGEIKLKELRKIEGELCHVLRLKGHFDENEAQRIVDICIKCHERIGKHPLQRATVFSGYCSTKNPDPNLNRTIHITDLFSHASIRAALTRRGFFLNIGQFSDNETLTLMRNFETFLRKLGLPTDKNSIALLLGENFQKFYHETKMFLYIGDNLNRTSGQMYHRLRSLYYVGDRGTYDAKSDDYILRREFELKRNGFHKRHKFIGEELNRLNKSISARFEKLKRKSKISSVNTTEIVNSIAKFQNCDVISIDVEKNLPFGAIGKELGLDGQELRKFWESEGKRKYARSLLPKWTLEDSSSLLDAIEATEERDENCVDFKAIYVESFRGKVENWQHLREHYNKLRRFVPFYVLKDLSSVVRATRIEIKKKIDEGNLEFDGDWEDQLNLS